jgi:hypothetical protein
MKNFMLTLFAVVMSTALFAQNAAEKKAEDVIKFKETTYNFGKIKQNVPVTHDFSFTNAGDKPLVIETATASCGCTTPVWPQTPVAKGKSDKITAGFNAAAPGAFTKQITVKIAGIEAPTQITITGEVLNAEEYAKYEKEKGKSTKAGGK